MRIDLWADTERDSKHAYIDNFIYGRTVNATGFAPSFRSFNNLPIANFLYAYYTPSGKPVLLENNNVIYLGITMEDGLSNQIQSKENDARIDI